MVGDVSFTHAKPDMWDVCTAYCLAIQAMLKNPEAELRAQMAIAAIKSYTKRDCISPNIKQWMQKAEMIYKRVKESGQDFFGNDTYNTCTN